MQVALALRKPSFAPPCQTFWEEWSARRQRCLTPHDDDDDDDWGGRYCSDTVHIAGTYFVA